jgi:hypothetical protein
VPARVWAARWARARRRPPAGRTSTCTVAVSLSASSPAAPSTARSGSTQCSVRSGCQGPPASRSSPPASTMPAARGAGLSGWVLVRAPGQQASTARTTSRGATVPGTHSPMLTPPVVQASSKLTWGRGSRGRRWRSSPARFPHSASAAAGSTWGGGRIWTRRAPGASRRCRHRRQPSRATTSPATRGTATVSSRSPHPVASDRAWSASSARLPPGSCKNRSSHVAAGPSGRARAAFAKLVGGAGCGCGRPRGRVPVTAPASSAGATRSSSARASPRSGPGRVTMAAPQLADRDRWGRW